VTWLHSYQSVEGVKEKKVKCYEMKKKIERISFHLSFKRYLENIVSQETPTSWISQV